ncbi:hypothetical protein WY02_21965 [Pseudonocardia sp. AL041005-10]|nr:hypothetical protein WY02_21965 [Pseudonocardia sp. AL041005-10]
MTNPACGCRKWQIRSAASGVEIVRRSSRSSSERSPIVSGAASDLTMSLATEPSRTVFTRIPRGASSSAR